MFLLKALARLPLSLLYILSDFISFINFYLVKYRYDVVYTNLKNSFPEKSEKEIRILIKKFYLNLTDWFVETLKASQMSAEELQRRIKFIDGAVIDHYLTQGRSVIAMATHQFNWEWMLLAGCLRFKVPIDAIYMPVSNKKMEAFMLNIRSRFGGLPIPKDETLPTIMKRIKEQRIIGLVADQKPAQDHQKKYWAIFLNQETAFFMGTESLPKLTKMPAVFMGIHKIRRGYYEVRVEEIAHPPYDYQQIQVLPIYIRKAEELIRSEPDGWLWSHRRWKYKRGAYE
jgi:KDO2-lipid IV(A) lauroyltransferase